MCPLVAIDDRGESSDNDSATDKEEEQEEEEEDASDTLAQKGKTTAKERKSKSSNVAELDDFVFDTLPVSKSDESELSDSDATTGATSQSRPESEYLFSEVYPARLITRT